MRDGGRSTGVVLVDGDELTAPRRASRPCTRSWRSCSCSTGDELPDDFVDDIERWNTRSGTVKINLAVDRLPEFTAKPGFDPEVHGGTIVLARSRSTRWSAPSRTPSPAGPPRGRSPTSASRRCSTARWRPRASTSCRCSRSGCPTSGRRQAACTPSSTPTPTGSWPRSRRSRRASPSSILHRQVIGPYEMEHEYGLVGGNIFHGELSPNQLFHLRPAPGYADFRTPIRGLYQAGSATHGGGGVTGIPALQAVRQIEHDERGGRLRRRFRGRRPTDRHAASGAGPRPAGDGRPRPAFGPGQIHDPAFQQGEQLPGLRVAARTPSTGSGLKARSRQSRQLVGDVVHAEMWAWAAPGSEVNPGRWVDFRVAGDTETRPNAPSGHGRRTLATLRACPPATRSIAPPPILTG